MNVELHVSKVSKTISFGCPKSWEWECGIQYRMG